MVGLVLESGGGTDAEDNTRYEAAFRDSDNAA